MVADTNHCAHAWHKQFLYVEKHSPVVEYLALSLCFRVFLYLAIHFVHVDSINES